LAWDVQVHPINHTAGRLKPLNSMEFASLSLGCKGTGNWLQVKSSEGEALLNPRTGKWQWLSPFTIVQLLEDEESAIVRSDDGKEHILSFRDGTTKPLPSSQKLRFALRSVPDSQLAGPKPRLIKSPVVTEAANKFLGNYELKKCRVSTDLIDSCGLREREVYLCPDRIISLAENPCVLNPYPKKADDCNSADCGAQKPAPKSMVSDFTEKASEILACASEYQESFWEEFAPIPAPPQMSDQQAKRLLMRFSKPGGFVPEKHRSALLGALRRSPTPELTLGALQNIVGTDPGLYESILDARPELRELSPKTGANFCRTTQERAKVLAGAKDFITRLKSRYRARSGGTAAEMQTYFDDWKDLKPLTFVLAQMPEAERDEEIATIGYSIAVQQDQDDFELYKKGLKARDYIPTSKVFLFTRLAVGPLFGKSHKPVSDLSIHHTFMNFQANILGTEPIEFGEKTPYGFYIRRMPALMFPFTDQTKIAQWKPQDQSVSWTQSGKKFHATVKLNVEAVPKGLITTKKGPDYDRMFKDGKRTGLAIAGANLKEWSYHSIVGYERFYSNRGFRFNPKDEQVIPSIKAFLGEKVSSGEADYVLKQEHFEGDERRIVDLDRVGRLRKGVKKLPDGREEVIYLLYPGDKAQALSGHARFDREYVNQSDLAKWFKARKANGGGEMLFQNNSCHGIQATGGVVMNIGDPDYVEIAAETSLMTFGNDPKASNYRFLDAFLAKKDYAEMRKATNPSHPTDFDEALIYPDESLYQEKILGGLTGDATHRIVSKIIVKDEKGKEVTIGRQLD